MFNNIVTWLIFNGEAYFPIFILVIGIGFIISVLKLIQCYHSVTNLITYGPPKLVSEDNTEPLKTLHTNKSVLSIHSKNTHSLLNSHSQKNKINKNVLLFVVSFIYFIIGIIDLIFYNSNHLGYLQMVYLIMLFAILLI